MGSIALLLVLVAAACLRAMSAPRSEGRSAQVRRPAAEGDASPRNLEAQVLVFAEDAVRRLGRDGETTLVDRAEDLGVVRLVERSRRRLLFLFARRGSLTYVAANLHGAPRGVVDALEEGATLVPDGLLPEGSFGTESSLDGAAALRLLCQVRRLAPHAVDRIVCASADEIALTLSGSTLVTGDLVFDLDAPLVWRPLAFHETGGDVGGVYQGTWLDQGEKRRIFVSPLPPLALWRDPAAGDDDPRPYDAADPVADARALALATSPAADPPPRELRVAVDALLMFPLRHALANAPGARRELAPWNRKPTALRQAR